MRRATRASRYLELCEVVESTYQALMSEDAEACAQWHANALARRSVVFPKSVDVGVRQAFCNGLHDGVAIVLALGQAKSSELSNRVCRGLREPGQKRPAAGDIAAVAVDAG